MIQRPLRFGALFAGYGGLEDGVQSVIGGVLAWYSEHEPPSEKNPRPSQAAARIMEYHHPGVPNLGDITQIDWHKAAPVDVLTGGSPCFAAGTPVLTRRGLIPHRRGRRWRPCVDARGALASGNRHDGARRANRRVPSGVLLDAGSPFLAAHPWTRVEQQSTRLRPDTRDSSLEPCPGCVGDRDDGPVLRALGRVLGDLAELGYDAWWCGIRASDVGAPHGRYRVFVFATPADAEDVGHERGRGTRPGRTGPENGGDAPADASRIGWDQWRPESAGIVRGLDAPERGSPHAPDADSDAVRVESVALAGSSGAPEPGWHGEAPADSDGDGLTRLGRVHAGERDPDGRGREGPTRDDAEPTAWGPYAPAIGRWAAALGRPAPPPTELGPKGAPRLSSRFVEWLMGLPAGHVTDVPGISRSDQLKALGNGVVPAQAAAATRRWLNDYANA